jgi:cytochrome c oxidase subunit IV
MSEENKQPNEEQHDDNETVVEEVKETVNDAKDATAGDHHPTTHDGAYAHSDTVTIPFIGDVTVAGGIYTVVFVYLGILTALEVIIAEFIDAPEGSLVQSLKILGLVATSIGKAVLVILFYMHLRWDNRILWVVLILPTVVVLISLFYLLSVPTSAGLGYPV